MKTYLKALMTFKTVFKSIQKKKIIDQNIEDYKNASSNTLEVNLVDTEGTYYLKVNVPGIEKEEIDIEAGKK